MSVCDRKGGPYGSAIVSIAATDGHLLWSVNPTRDKRWKGLIYTPDRLLTTAAIAVPGGYIIGYDAGVVLFVSSSGTIGWMASLAQERGELKPFPGDKLKALAVADGRIYCDLEDGICILDATTGKLVGREPGRLVPDVGHGILIQGSTQEAGRIIAAAEPMLQNFSMVGGIILSELQCGGYVWNVNRDDNEVSIMVSNSKTGKQVRRIVGFDRHRQWTVSNLYLPGLVMSTTDTVLVQYETAALACYTPSGELLWEDFGSLPENDRTNGILVVDSNIYIVGETDISILDVATGKLKARYPRPTNGVSAANFSKGEYILAIKPNIITVLRRE